MTVRLVVMTGETLLGEIERPFYLVVKSCTDLELSTTLLTVIVTV